MKHIRINHNACLDYYNPSPHYVPIVVSRVDGIQVLIELKSVERESNRRAVMETMLHDILELKHLMKKTGIYHSLYPEINAYEKKYAYYKKITAHSKRQSRKLFDLMKDKNFSLKELHTHDINGMVTAYTNEKLDHLFFLLPKK